MVSSLAEACIRNDSIQKVIIIGAGPAGLVSARHAIAKGYHVTIYEQNSELGGVWVYTDEIGRNKYGVNTHTAMYQGLRYVQCLNVIRLVEILDSIDNV